MAIQSTSGLLGLGGVLTQSLFQSLFTSSLRTFVQAQTQLLQTPSNPLRTSTDSSLRSRISALTAVSNVASLTKADFDIADSSLESVSGVLSSLTTLATSAISADAATRTSLQSQADSLVAQIKGELAQTRNDDPDLTIPVQLGTAGATNVVSSVDISSLDRTIDSSGVSFSLDVSDTGSRAFLNNVITTGGNLDAGSEFTISGAKGSVTLEFTASTSVADVVAEINENSASTGVIASVDGNNIDFNSSEFGSAAFATITQVSDPGGQIADATDTGSDAVATLTETVSGSVLNLTATGRKFSFTLENVTGSIQLITDTTTLGGSVDPAAAQFTVRDGGKALLGSDGSILSRVGIPAFDFGTLGRSLGGLDTLDLENDPGGALAIIAQAQTDITTSRTLTSFAADTFLGSQITSLSDQIGAANTALTDIDTVSNALAVFEQVAAESRLNISLAILSQLSGLYPLSASSLV